MNNSPLSGPLLAMLITIVPALLVGVVGTIVAAINWWKCPTSSLLVILAMAAFVLIRVINSGISYFGVQLAREQWNWTGAEIGRLYAINGVVGTMGSMLAFAMLIAAVYVGRTPAWSQSEQNSLK